jgi:CrcB protein
MEFANPFKGKPPDDFSANNSYRQTANERATVGFFMLMYLWVALGSAIGGVSRFWLSGLIAGTRFGSTFPLGTLVINVTGSFAIGFFNASTDTDGRFFAPASVRTFFMIGVCGGYTTFSSFSLQTLNLANEGEWFRAGTNVFFSVVLCLGGVWLGHIVANYLNSTNGG